MWLLSKLLYLKLKCNEVVYLMFTFELCLITLSLCASFHLWAREMYTIKHINCKRIQSAIFAIFSGQRNAVKNQREMSMQIIFFFKKILSIRIWVKKLWSAYNCRVNNCESPITLVTGVCIYIFMWPVPLPFVRNFIWRVCICLCGLFSYVK